MENEIDKLNFNFNEKIKFETKPKVSKSMMKKIQITAFLMIGGLSVGIGLGITNGIVEGYKVSKESDAQINIIKTKNNEILRMKKAEVELLTKAKEAEIELHQNQKNKEAEENLRIDQNKKAYQVWTANKEDIIANYENQLNIYDNAYQDMIYAVDNGLIGLEDLSVVRGHYQNYKREIHKIIRFINRATNSFDQFVVLNEENREYLNSQLIAYQNGDLNRSSELEQEFFRRMGEETQDTAAGAKNRQNLKSKIIDDLTVVMNNNTSTTKIKKLKN